MQITLAVSGDELWLGWEADHLACLPEVMTALSSEARDDLAGWTLVGDTDAWSDEYPFSGMWIFEKASI